VDGTVQHDFLDFLGTITEFSIGLAGFAGIVAALGTYNRSELAVVRFRLSNLLVSSFAPGFFSMLTFVLIYGAMEVDTAIRVSSGALAVYLCGWAVFAYSSKPGRLSRVILVTMSAATVINVAVQLAAAAGLSPLPVVSYLSGLILLLLQGAAVFVVLVMDALKSGGDE
jgi:hypothetical protein